MTLSLVVVDPRREAMPQQPPPGHHLASAGLIQAVGVFALSSTAHSTLPALRTAMRQPARFPLALGLGFATMLAGYATLAAVGYWYFGDSASPLVATDLAGNSAFTGGRVPLQRVLAALVLLNSLTKASSACLQGAGSWAVACCAGGGSEPRRPNTRGWAGAGATPSAATPTTAATRAAPPAGPRPVVGAG